MIHGERPCRVLNRTMELSECRDGWTFSEEYGCWCLEDVAYKPEPEAPHFQRLSIFAPAQCMNRAGVLTETAKRMPVVFENNAAGYMEMPHTWLGGPRCFAEEFLAHGLVYITCGCRGRESRDADGMPVGRAPMTLIDLKTALRFLRHNQACLPGNYDRIISIGWSAGGAMSSLLALTGDHPDYDGYLRAGGAFMEESDAVYAAQIYCPIIDLEHADMAYEWQFCCDRTCEDSPAGPAETMTPFKEALSRRLHDSYIGYVNALELRHPVTDAALKLEPDGRSGAFYDYLMEMLEQAAAKHLRTGIRCTPEQYIAGEYTQMKPAPRRTAEVGAQHHAGAGVQLAQEGQEKMGLGERLLRPETGTQMPAPGPRMIPVPGVDKRGWLSWDGCSAHIRSLDALVLGSRRRMKPCTAFDKLTCDSGENELFGGAGQERVHFSQALRGDLEALTGEYPAEVAAILAQFPEKTDARLASGIHLLNPMNYVSAQCRQAEHFRIRVGTDDADTAYTISMTLALRLANTGHRSVDYALVWDQPHDRADYPGELLTWIDQIC